MARPTLEIGTNPAQETIRLGPLAVRFLITGENANGSIAAFELEVPAAQRLAAPAHSHDHYEETIYGIEGVLTWTVDGKPIEVGPGQALCIPRGAVHRFHNPGIRPATLLLVYAPGGPEGLFVEGGDAPVPGTQVQPSGPERIDDRMLGLLAKYDTALP